LADFTTATSGAQPELTSLAAIPIQGQVCRFSLRPETALLFSNRRRGFLVLRLLQEKRRPEYLVRSRNAPADSDREWDLR
jgi:hypothetical protein